MYKYRCSKKEDGIPKCAYFYKKLRQTSSYKCPPQSKYYPNIEGGSNCICVKKERSPTDIYYSKIFNKF